MLNTIRRFAALTRQATVLLIPANEGTPLKDSFGQSLLGGKERTGKQQEEEVKAALVEVLGQPVTAQGVGDDGDRQDHCAGQVRANGDGEQLQRHGAAAHHVRGLVVEELELPDGRQHLRALAGTLSRHVPDQHSTVWRTNTWPLIATSIANSISLTTYKDRELFIESLLLKRSKKALWLHRQLKD